MWNGAEEKDRLPEGRIDLAYSLRASDWRGTPQVQMEFVDFRMLTRQPVEVKGSQLEVMITETRMIFLKFSPT